MKEIPLTDAYNVAIKHLQGKYGKVLGYTSSFSNKLQKARNIKERKEIESTATDRNRNIIIVESAINDENDKSIMLSVKQYNCLHTEPKKELEYLLKRLNIDFVPKYIN